MNDPRAVEGNFPDFPHLCGDRGIQIRILQYHVRERNDAALHVIEVMSQTTGKNSQALQLLLAQRRLLGAFEVGYVNARTHVAREDAASLESGDAGVEHPSIFAVVPA